MDKYFNHRDFYLGAYLVTQGCELLSHSRDRGLTTFTFANSPHLQQLVEQFYALKGNVDALTYSSAIRSLKSVIHSTSNSNSTRTNSNDFFNKQKGNK